MFQPTWRQIQKTNYSSFPPLFDFLELSLEDQAKIWTRPPFPLNLPARLAGKIKKNTLSDPILRQFVSLIEEQETAFGSPEPLQDQKFRQTKKVLKKYTGRALLLTTGACAMHCRFCFRQNFPYEREERQFDREIAYLKENPTISEIILSGGDPLSLSDATLSSLFEAFENIPHIKRIRFHTRFPIGIPERIDSSFLSLLQASSKQIVFIIHCNHPKEIDADVAASLKKIQELTIPTLNQSVLLKGVNDDEKTLLTLSETLIDIGVIPYYLHLHDPVTRTGHFNVSEKRGMELIRHLQENLSGYGVPRLVREIPGRPSKTFIETLNI